MVGERTIDGQVFVAATLFRRACGLIRVFAVSVSRWPRPGWSEALGGRAQRRERDSRSESQRETEGAVAADAAMTPCTCDAPEMVSLL